MPANRAPNLQSLDGESDRPLTREDVIADYRRQCGRMPSEDSIRLALAVDRLVRRYGSRAIERGDPLTVIEGGRDDAS